MPTKREREYYRMGFSDGLKDARRDIGEDLGREVILRDRYGQVVQSRRKPKRKLSAWNKYVKNKRNHIRYRDGKLNLKKMAVAFRRKKRR
tara:strand:- start:242 stop:511 length:270 start_codon:yes stop_codon:yes gene_type:complete